MSWPLLSLSQWCSRPQSRSQSLLHSQTQLRSRSHVKAANERSDQALMHAASPLENPVGSRDLTRQTHVRCHPKRHQGATTCLRAEAGEILGAQMIEAD